MGLACTLSPVAAAPAPSVAGPAAAVVASPATPAAPSVPAAPLQEDGLETRTTSTYVVDPEAGAIRVTVEVSVTNQIPNRTRGGIIEQAYFSEIGVPILAEARDLVATRAGGGTAAVTTRDIGIPYARSAVIELEPNLFYGQTQSLTLTYNLPNQPPRSPGLTRANDAFVTFPAFTFGDPGMGSIEVRLPERFDVEVVRGELERSTADGQTVLSAENLDNPDAFLAFVVATDEEKLVIEPVDVEGAEVEVRAWPDDPAWADFAATNIADAKPVLEDLLGLPWPREEPLAVVESTGPYAYGYAGWYSEADGMISVGDELDPLVLTHELSHVWFNSQLFDDRWVAEGFAEVYATLALEELDQPQDGAAVPNRSGAGAVALNDWSDPFLLDESSAATETYGYATSRYVIDQVVAEVGVEAMQEVLAAARERTIPYAGDPEPESYDSPVTWQVLLDLVENRAGSAEATGLWDAYVVNDEQREQLAARTEARAVYDQLVEQGDGWTPPLEVRMIMSRWDFPALEDAVAEAEDVLAVRADIEEALEGLDVADLGLEDAYETATNTEDLLPVAEATLEAAQAYGAADAHMDEGEGLLGAVGLLFSGTDDRLETARRELEAGDPEASLRASQAVERRLDTAVRDGILRIVAVVLLLGAVLYAYLRVRRWRRDRRRRRAERLADAELAKLPGFAPVDPLVTPGTGSRAHDPADSIDAPEPAGPGGAGSGAGRGGRAGRVGGVRTAELPDLTAPTKPQPPLSPSSPEPPGGSPGSSSRPSSAPSSASSRSRKRSFRPFRSRSSRSGDDAPGGKDATDAPGPKAPGGPPGPEPAGEGTPNREPLPRRRSGITPL